MYNCVLSIYTLIAVVFFFSYYTVGGIVAGVVIGVIVCILLLIVIPICICICLGVGIGASCKKKLRRPGVAAQVPNQGYPAVMPQF